MTAIDRMLRARPSNLLFKAAAATLRAHTEGSTLDNAARRLYGKEHGLDLVLRAASNPATLNNPQWAGVVGHDLIRDLIQEIVSISAAAALMDHCIRVDLTGLASLTIPGRLVDPTSAGDWVAEGAPIKVRDVPLTAGPKLVPRKLAVITSYTREQLESSAIEAIVRMAITEAAALLLDLRLFSNIPADANGPAGILINATPVAPTTAAAPWAISSDLGALVGALATQGGGARPVFIASPAQAIALNFWKTQQTFDVLASQALAPGTVVALESTSFVSATDPTPYFQASTGVLIHFEDTTPTDIVSGGVPATPTKSVFQIDATALKMILRASWGLRNSAHVAIMEGTSW